MNDLEERLRRTTRAAAEQIPPDRVPPLRTPAPGRLRRAAGVLVPGRPRWPGRLVPLATAIAVVALAAGSLVIARTVARPATPARGGAADAAAVAAARAVLPAYYASLRYSPALGAAQPGSLVISASATGNVLTTVTPPRGEEFTAVSAAADDRTFVAAAETHAQVAHRMRDAPTARGLAAAAQPARFYLIRFDTVAGAARVTPLAVPGLPDVTDFALSPGGTGLAVAVATSGTISIRLYPLGGGTARTWSAATHQHGAYRWEGIDALSWTRGGKLGFGVLSAQANGNAPFGLLDTGAPGGSLLPASTVFPGGPCSPLMFAADGSLIITTTTSQGALPWLLRECRISHGRAIVTVPHLPVRYGRTITSLNTVLWASPAGQTLILGASYGGMLSSVVGVFAGTEVKSLASSATVPYGSMFPGAPAAW